MLNELKTNKSGYPDPTAFKAMRKVESERNKKYKDSDYIRFHKLLKSIFTICEKFGFHLESRITVKDKRTGKIWR